MTHTITRPTLLLLQAGGNPRLHLDHLHPNQREPCGRLMELAQTVDVGVCLHALQVLAGTDPRAVAVLTALHPATVRSLLRSRQQDFAGLLPHELVQAIVSGLPVDHHAFQVVFQQRRLERRRQGQGGPNTGNITVLS